MITKAAFALALVWLCAPHHPDLGLGAKGCAAAGGCSFAQGSDVRREMIWSRLRDVRAEIRQARHS